MKNLTIIRQKLKRCVSNSLHFAINGVFLATLCMCSTMNASGKTIRFCVTGDSRGSKVSEPINDTIIKKQVRALISERPAFVLFAGDLVLGYSHHLENELPLWKKAFMEPLKKAGVEVYACRGDHEMYTQELKKGERDKTQATAKIWRSVFSGKFAFPDNGPRDAKQLTYYVRKGNVLVFVLDNYTTQKSIDEVDVKWMKKVFAKESRKRPGPLRVFAICHAPAFSVVHKDCLETKKEKRDAFVKAFVKMGGVAFFCGHDHLYDHSVIKTPDGEFRQFVCGTAGASLVDFNGKYRDNNVVNIKTEKEFGFMVVDILPTKTVLTMKAWSNSKKKKPTVVDKVEIPVKK